MANSRFVVINAAHDNGHSESVFLVSSLSVLIVLLPCLLRYTRMAKGKLSFSVMLTGEYRVFLHTKYINCTVNSKINLQPSALPRPAFPVASSTNLDREFVCLQSTNPVQYSWLTSFFWFRSIFISLWVERTMCIYSMVRVEIEGSEKLAVTEDWTKGLGPELPTIRSLSCNHQTTTSSCNLQYIYVGTECFTRTPVTFDCKVNYKPWQQTGSLHRSIWSHPLLPGPSPAHWTVEISPAAQMRVPGRWAANTPPPLDRDVKHFVVKHRIFY